MGFVQVWLDVVAIGINNIEAFDRAGKTSLSISCYYLTLSKANQRFRADGILMPHLLQSPNVVRNIFTTIFYNLQFLKIVLDSLLFFESFLPFKVFTASYGQVF